ncbi:hypothetical protein QAD02_010323 [Eretmocerus hayati]|uniref:Uncharacterized protein n=1 Tax=Eretmocerus hayati TaxID=131215 RepID=A0ACC2NBY2_9HYME|nr:hypothetical protein QAD02_010323 [Eretmocerus hayati]
MAALIGTRFYIITSILSLAHVRLIFGIYTRKIDWSELNSTISVVDPKITEIGRFTYLACDYNQNDKVKICRIHEDSLQSNETYSLCATVLTSSDGSDAEVWPFITPLGRKFIVPWYNTSDSGPFLVLRFIQKLDSQDCQSQDLILGLTKNQLFKIVPFSDSFDVIYDGGFDESSRAPVVLKMSFDENGNKLGEPTSLFAQLQSSVFDGITTKLRSNLDLVKPVSPYDASKGYFFIPLNRELNQISILSPDGFVTKTANLDVPLSGTTYTMGNETIVLVSTENNGTNFIYKLLQLDSDLNPINNVTYVLAPNKRHLKFEDVFNTIVAVTAETKFWAFTGEIYLEKLYSNGIPGKRITIMNDVTPANYNKFEVYKSLCDQNICINLLFKDEKCPKLKYTSCIALSTLDEQYL